MNRQQRTRKYAHHRVDCRCARGGKTCYVNGYEGPPKKESLFDNLYYKVHRYFEVRSWSPEMQAKYKEYNERNK